MKVIILAAGRGERLNPFTKDTPKPLLDVGGKPIIIHALERLKECNIKDIIIVIGYKGDLIKEKIGENYKGIKIKYIYNPDYSTKNLDYSLYCAKDEIKNEPFIYLEGDLFFHSKIIKKLMESKYNTCLCVDKMFRSSKVDTILFGKKNKAKGVIRKEHGDIREKVQNEGIVGELVYIIKFDKDSSNFLFQELEKTNFTGITKIDNILNEFIKVRGLNYIETENLPWVEIDNFEDLEKARNLINYIN